MVGSLKRPRVVGRFIRERRENLGLSQKALGLLFTPAVTTQFISNIERGVTPLPPVHVTTLSKALQVSGAELLAMLEREYSVRLSNQMGLAEDNKCSAIYCADEISIGIHRVDYEFMNMVYKAYKDADTDTKQMFAATCENIFRISKK
ncbi:MAG: helix-turn-helix transcriptional regulator [Bdellovibrionota bacterium]